MNSVEHTFPLPEIETHKLDEVKELLPDQSTTDRVAAFFGENTWLKWALAGTAGVIAGFWLRKSRLRAAPSPSE